MNHNDYMMQALDQAHLASQLDEVPVGAVLVHNGEVIAKTYNTKEHQKNALGHAELLAIDEGCKKLGGWRLPNCTLYVTLEPCPMCAGAIANARIEHVVFGAYDTKSGAYGSLFNLNNFPINHKPEVIGGVLENECSSVLTSYFKNKRKKGVMS